MRKGFTLAEVLITLGIIGIVAALTLPTLIEKHREQVTVAKVKKFYSTINQALQFAINENGTIDQWNYAEANKQSNKFFDYFRPYLKITKDCGSRSGCIGEGRYFTLNNSTSMNYDTHSSYYKIILGDGSFMWLRQNRPDRQFNGNCAETDAGYNNVCGIIWFDVNGKAKPNIIGQDTFVFVILKDKITPQNINDCKLGQTGWGCSKYILLNGNMNYLKEP